jgi:hypothetical protein
VIVLTIRGSSSPTSARDLLLHRLDEVLLADDAVEVGVGMAKRRSRGLLPAEMLVARVQVDRGVILAVRVVVEIPVVDVDVDAAELVDDVNGSR